MAGLLYALNGFVFYRLVIGHLPYHAFALAPLLAYAVLGSHRGMPGSSSEAPGKSVATGIVVTGLVVAYFTYAGALNLEIPLVMTAASDLLMPEAAAHGSPAGAPCEPPRRSDSRSRRLRRAGTRRPKARR